MTVRLGAERVGARRPAGSTSRWTGGAYPMAPLPGGPAGGRRRRGCPPGTDYAFRLDGGDPLPTRARRASRTGPTGRAGPTTTPPSRWTRRRVARGAGERRGDLRAARRHVHPGGDARRRDRAARPPDGARRHGRRADAARRVPRRARLGLRRDRPVGRARALRRARTRSSGSWTPATPAGSPSSSTSSTTTSARATGSRSFGPYFTDVYTTPWGPAVNLDQPGSDEVRAFIVGNALMWLRDYHLDGLRLDAVHALQDHRAVHLLEELAVAVDALSAADRAVAGARRRVRPQQPAADHRRARPAATAWPRSGTTTSTTRCTRW